MKKLGGDFMILKHLEDDGQLVGYAFTIEEIIHIVPLWYIKNLANSEGFTVQLEQVVTGTLNIKGSMESAEYSNKDIVEINKDFSYLSFALFGKDNDLVCVESEFVIPDIKPKLNMSINIKSASIQGSLVVIEVEELGNNSVFKPIVEYELLIKLASKTVYVYNDISGSVNDLLTLAFTGKNIAIVRKENKATLHNIVSAHINQSLDYIIDSVIGKIAVLSSIYKNSDSVVYKVECKYLAEDNEDILLLSTFFTEADYTTFLKKAKSGVLVVENGQTILATKIYSQVDIIRKMIRR